MNQKNRVRIRKIKYNLVKSSSTQKHRTVMKNVEAFAQTIHYEEAHF